MRARKISSAEEFASAGVPVEVGAGEYSPLPAKSNIVLPQEPTAVEINFSASAKIRTENGVLNIFV